MVEALGQCEGEAPNLHRYLVGKSYIQNTGSYSPQTNARKPCSQKQQAGNQMLIQMITQANGTLHTLITAVDLATAQQYAAVAEWDKAHQGCSSNEGARSGTVGGTEKLPLNW